MLQALSLTTKL